jgi:hypothetical protein
MRIQVNWVLKILLVNIILACLLTTYKHSKLSYLLSLSISSSKPTLALNETIVAVNSFISEYSADIRHLLAGIYSGDDDENSRDYYFLIPEENHFEWRQFCDSKFHSNIFRYLPVPKILNSSLIPPLEISKPCLSSFSLEIPVPPAASPTNRTLLVISTYNSLLKVIELLGSLQNISDYDILVIDDSSTDGTLETLQKMVRQSFSHHQTPLS